MGNIINKLALVRNIDTLPNKILVNGRNIELDRNMVNITNARGNELLFSTTHPICGIITSQDALVIFSTDDADISEIGIYREGGTYETIIIGNFGFRVVSPITGIIDYNVNSELIVAWTDAINPIGVLNIDNTPFVLPLSKIASAIELNLCKLFPDVIVPTITPTKIVDGGSLKTGTCQIVCTYVLPNGDYVNWLANTNPIPIGNVNPKAKYSYEADTEAKNDHVYNDSYDAIQELDLNSVSKSIVLNITNLDTRYTKIKLAAIHKHKGGIFVQEIGDFSYTGKTELTVIYNGQFSNTLSISEITTNTITYDKCETMTLVGNRLLLGNIEINTVIDYQPFANAIKVGWKVKNLAYDEKIYTDTKSVLCHIDPILAANDRTLMPDEVYALYVVPIFTDGSKGRAFHMPGRIAEPLNIPSISSIHNAYENELLNNDTFFSADEFKHVRTISDSVKYFHTFDTSSKSEHNNAGYNKMSFWENENEYYPDVESYHVKEVDANGLPITIGTIANQRVRHHKTPSFDTIYNEGDIINKAIYLEFRNIHIPKEFHDKIQGLRFYYAERGSENMTVLGEYPMMQELFPTVGGEGDELTDDMYYNLRFNDYNLLVNKPALNVSYIKSHYKSLNDVSGKLSVNDFRVKTSLSFDYNSKHYAEDFRDTLTFNYHKFDIRTNTVIPIEHAKYLPNDNAATTPSNRGKESTVSIKIPDTINMQPYFSEPYSHSHIITLNKLILDAYADFTIQKLVATNNILRMEVGKYIYDAIDVNGFDTFINSYRTMMYRGDRSITDPEALETEKGIGRPITALFNDVKFTAYSIINTPYRIDILTGEFEDKYKENYFFKKDESAIRITNVNVNPSIESLPKYYIDYSAIDNIKSILKYNTIDNFITKLPYRIPRSNVQGKETLNIAWRLFNPLDYYDIVKNKGEIVSLQSIDKGVMIQTKYSLFKAIIKDKLMTLDTETYLGTGELFDREPDEILPTGHGYIGCQSKLTVLLDEIGYFVFDSSTNRAFIVDQGIKEITNQLVKEYFNARLDIHGASLVGQRMVAAFDPLNHRVVISNPADIPFTINYYLGGEDMGFLSKDDYIPHLFATTRTNLYSVDNANKNKVYIHNANNRGVFYGTRFPSKIGVLFNFEDETEVHDVSLKTEVIKAGTKYDESISKLLIYNQFQSSGNIDMSVFSDIDDYNTIRNIGNSWNFNHFRDMSINPNLSLIDADGDSIASNINKSKDWREQSPFISNLVVVQMEFDNADDKEFYLNDVNVDVELFKR